MKTAYMFSGQGAQYCGMGKELYEQFAEVRSLFNQAEDILSYKIKDICFTENPRLNETTYTQPAVYLTDMAALTALNTLRLPEADYHFGLSLGEYAALTASSAFSFDDGLALVGKRGKYMEEAVPAGIGAMAAVLSLSRELTEQSCRESEGQVWPANYNMPGQIVISGEKAAVERASKRALDLGAKRVIPLVVSGPFHTPMLKEAAEKLAGDLGKLTINPLKTPVITNVTAREISNQEQVAPTLEKQIVSPVLWEDSVRYLIDKGVGRFIELGPGRTLCTFVKKIDKNVEVFNIENLKSLEKTAAAF